MHTAWGGMVLTQQARQAVAQQQRCARGMAWHGMARLALSDHRRWQPGLACAGKPLLGALPARP